jgi:hypothetical protein
MMDIAVRSARNVAVHVVNACWMARSWNRAPCAAAYYARLSRVPQALVASVCRQQVASLRRSIALTLVQLIARDLHGLRVTTKTSYAAH